MSCSFSLINEKSFCFSNYNFVQTLMIFQRKTFFLSRKKYLSLDDNYRLDKWKNFVLFGFENTEN